MRNASHRLRGLALACAQNNGNGGGTIASAAALIASSITTRKHKISEPHTQLCYDAMNTHRVRGPRGRHKCHSDSLGRVSVGLRDGQQATRGGHAVEAAGDAVVARARGLGHNHSAAERGAVAACVCHSGGHGVRATRSAKTSER